MLRWRLLLGTLIIGTLVGLGWLDHYVDRLSPPVPGLPLLPVAIAFTVLATGEMLYLTGAGRMRPLPWAVYCGNLLMLASHWMPAVCGQAAGVAPMAWPLLALAAGVLLVLVGEMCRYEKPGGVTANVAAAVFCLVYVGGMLSFAVQLRMSWGVGALASLIIVVKLGDTGAYTVGRLLGRRKLAPVLSPGKTIEGLLGGLAFACLGSWATFTWLVPNTVPGWIEEVPVWGWVSFGLAVALAGLLGDLAESLVKRDVGCKDSSRWLPGFGGVLDILDSILLAAPVAWFWWFWWTLRVV